MKRKDISKRTRFEVFKRDSFRCQYCGRSAVDNAIVLNIEHIVPVSKGGDNSILNLTTACFDCNSGKADTLLTESETISKQRIQLEKLAERREQVELIIKWRNEIANGDAKLIEALCTYWEKLTCNSVKVIETGKRILKKLLRQFPYDEIHEAMTIASEQYDLTDADCEDYAFSKIGGICFNRKQRSKEIK